MPILTVGHYGNANFLLASDVFIRAACTMLVVSALPWLLMLVTPSVAQRTYQRHCDCEYWVDGRCAYTLLLPTTSSADMTCPLSNTSGTISRLQDDVSALQTWTGEQAKATVMLQNSVVSLTDAVQRLRTASHSQNAATDAVKAAVDQLNRTIVELTALCGSRCSDHQLPAETDTSRLERRLVSKYRLCSVRGLIVSSIDNSAITASSVNQSLSTSDVRINSTSAYNDSGGWCPSDLGESLYSFLR